MRKIILSLVIAMCAIANSHAQYGQKLYSRDTVEFSRFTDGLYSTANPVLGLNPYAAVGVTAGNNIMDRSQFVRISSAGGTLANRINFLFRNGAEYSHRLNSICEAPTRYVMAGTLTGNTVLPVPGGGDVLIVRTAVSGIINSARTIDLNGGNDEAMCIIQSAVTAGRVYTCGRSSTPNISRPFVMATNNTGSTVNWSRVYQLPCALGAVAGNGIATSLAEDVATGTVVVVGNVQSPGCQNAFVSKFTAAGVHLWTHIFNQPNGFIQFRAIKPHPTVANAFVIVGTCSNGAGLNDVLMLTINAAGAAPVILQQQCLVAVLPAPVPNNGQINSMMANDVTSRINFMSGLVEHFIAGTATLQNGTTEAFTIKTNAALLPISGMVYGGAFIDGFNAIDHVNNGAVAGDGLAQFGYYDLNNPNSTTPMNQRSYFVKSYYNHVSGCNERPLVLTSLLPNLQSLPFVPIINVANVRDSLNWQQANGIVKQLCWNAVLGTGSNLRTDYIALNNNNIPQLTIFPNPINEAENLTLQINSPTECQATVSIYNISGEVIDQFILTLTEGANTAITNTQMWQAGMYFVQVQMADNVLRTKILKN